MTAMAGRSVAGVAAGLALAVSLTGCRANGGKSAAPRGSTPTRTLTAAQALEQASERAARLTSVQGSFSASGISASGEDEGPRSGSKGGLKLRLKPTSATMFKTRDWSEIFVGDRLYLKFPVMSAITGKTWVSFPLDDPGAKSGFDPEALETERHEWDPDLYAKMFTASKDAQVMGAEPVGNVRTIHYKGTLTLKDTLAVLDPAKGSQVKAAFELAYGDKLDFDAWVDGQRLTREITIATPLEATTKAKVTIVYRDFDVPVSIMAPPAGEVMDGKKFEVDGGDIPDIPV